MCIRDREKVGEELKETNTSNKNTMAKKKKEQAVQEEPTQTVKTAAEEKPDVYKRQILDGVCSLIYTRSGIAIFKPPRLTI